MDFLEFLGVVAIDKVSESSQNEILFDNFIKQAKEKQILKLLNNNCNIEVPGTFFGKSNKKIDINFENDAYLDLYDYLVNKNIITNNLGKSTIITWNSVYIINQDKIKNKNSFIIECNNLFNKEINSDFPELLTCYSIDIDKLYNFLKTYKNSATDEFELIADAAGVKKGGKTKKTKKNSPKKKQSKNKTKLRI